MVLATHILTLTGCASTSTLDWLRDEHADAIAEDLVIAVSSRLPPANSPVFIEEMPLRDHFENAIREHGYAVVTDPDDATTIGGIGERIPPNTWHVGLTIDEGIRIHRLYHVEHDNIHALSSVSVGDYPEQTTETAAAPSSRWHMRTLERTMPAPAATLSPRSEIETESISPNITTGPFLPVVETTAPVPVAMGVSNCPSTDGAVFTFPIGSLKQGLENALRRCGWRITTWPNADDEEDLIVDWIVSAETDVYFDSIEDLISGLHATYGIHAEVDEELRAITFWIDDA